MAGADLSGKIALVTGASRGVGKGVAIGLGKAGATVYITGRTRGGGDTSLDATAAAIEAAGGRCIPVTCDHGDDAQVADLFTKIGREQAGRLDILVSNAIALHPNMADPGGFWELPVELADLLTIGLRSGYVAAWHAARLMVPRRSGLIVHISFYAAAVPGQGIAYSAGKAGTDRMALEMARDLRPHDVASVAFWPGYVETEFVQGLMAAKPEMRAEWAANGVTLETPEFSGHVIAHLAGSAPRSLMSLSGQALIAAELAREHGILDRDGVQPPSYRETMGGPPDVSRWAG